MSKNGSMEISDILEGTYVHWVADRYSSSWDIYGKIVSVIKNDKGLTTTATILGFDDMRENTIGYATVLEECSVVGREEAMLYLKKKILGMKSVLLDKENEVVTYQKKIVEAEKALEGI